MTALYSFFSHTATTAGAHLGPIHDGRPHAHKRVILNCGSMDGSAVAYREATRAQHFR